MKTSKAILLFTALSIMLNGCIVIAKAPVPAITEQPEFIATNTVPENNSTPIVPAKTATPTEEPIVETPIPTKSLPSTLTPTPTEILPVEWDIDPYIIEDIEGVYRGVTIKARFIVDRSLEDIVESVEINDNVFAEMIVKSLATVWYAREKTDPWQIVQPIELNRVIDNWAKAQETGYEYYWRQIQLNRIWANDLNDGNDYSEKSYNFWPMYEGTTPYGVVGIDKITIVILDVAKSDAYNFDTSSRSVTKSRLVKGSNLDKQNLIIYSGRDMEYSVANMIEIHKYAYNPLTQKSATQLALQLNLVGMDEYLIYNDVYAVIEQDLGSNNSLWEQAVKYELKEE